MLKVISRFCLLTVFLWQTSALHAEVGDSTRNDRYYVGVTGGYGFLWAHSPGMGNMVNDHIISGELRLSKQTTGTQQWERDFHLPQYGISLLAMNLGDKDRLGYGFGIIPFINFPLGERERKVKMHFYLGWGPGWVTKIFDAETNHQNNAIGSHVNGCIRLRLNARAPIGERMMMEGGLELTHFSNGAAKFPNLGINLPAVTLGLHYSILQKSWGQKLPPENPRELPLLRKRWSKTICISTGVNALDLVSTKRYGACNILTYVMWQKSAKHKFGGGIDLMWSAGIMERRSRRGDDVTVVNNVQPGLKFCYELVLGRMSWPFEVGAYLYSPLLINGSVYNRFGIRYNVTEHLRVGVHLKTNMTVAEYFEVCAGWKF